MLTSGEWFGRRTSQWLLCLPISLNMERYQLFTHRLKLFEIRKVVKKMYKNKNKNEFSENKSKSHEPWLMVPFTGCLRQGRDKWDYGQHMVHVHYKGRLNGYFVAVHYVFSWFDLKFRQAFIFIIRFLKEQLSQINKIHDLFTWVDENVRFDGPKDENVVSINVK